MRLSPSSLPNRHHHRKARRAKQLTGNAHRMRKNGRQRERDRKPSHHFSADELDPPSLFLGSFYDFPVSFAGYIFGSWPLLPCLCDSDPWYEWKGRRGNESYEGQEGGGEGFARFPAFYGTPNNDPRRATMKSHHQLTAQKLPNMPIVLNFKF